MNFKSSKKDNIALINGKVYFPKKNKIIKSNILIENGYLKEIDYNKSLDNFNIIDCKNKIISPGFLDIRSHFGEPGFEDKETLESGSIAALSGGYTKVCMLPNSCPVLDNPEIIESIYSKSKHLGIHIYPIGSISKNMEGLELSEIGLMCEKGVIAISDGVKCVQNPQLMRNALEYAKMFDIPVINHPEDIYLKNNGIMNESFFSTAKGFPAIPSIAESTIVYRDLEIANFVGGKLHIPHVSTKESVELIKHYKDKGLKVTAEASPHHIGLFESEAADYQSKFKITPPLRTEEDTLALIEGLREGVIDCISTDHFPHRLEDKETDIITAAPGSIGLESAFPYTYNILSNQGFHIEDILKLFIEGPNKVVNINWDPLELGKTADLNIINPDIKWNFNFSNIYSKSKNSILLEKDMKGKVEKTIHGNIVYDFT